MRRTELLKAALQKHLQLIFINAFVNDTRIAGIFELKAPDVRRQFAEGLVKAPYSKLPTNHKHIEAYKQAYKEVDLCLIAFQPGSDQEITDILEAAEKKVNETFQRKEDKAYFQEWLNHLRQPQQDLTAQQNQSQALEQAVERSSQPEISIIQYNKLKRDLEAFYETLPKKDHDLIKLLKGETTGSHIMSHSAALRQGAERVTPTDAFHRLARAVFTVRDNLLRVKSKAKVLRLNKIIEDNELATILGVEEDTVQGKVTFLPEEVKSTPNYTALKQDIKKLLRKLPEMDPVRQFISPHVIRTRANPTANNQAFTKLALSIFIARSALARQENPSKTQKKLIKDLDAIIEKNYLAHRVQLDSFVVRKLQMAKQSEEQPSGKTEVVSFGVTIDPGKLTQQVGSVAQALGDIAINETGDETYVQALSRHIADKKEKPQAPESSNLDFIQKYEALYRQLSDLTENGHADPNALLNQIVLIKTRANELPNNQALLKEIRLLEIRAHRAKNQLIPQAERPRIQLYELLNDMEKLIKADYKDIAFEKVGYKPGFWEAALKSLATQHAYRQNQIDFIRSVMGMAQTAISEYESRPCESDEARNTFYSQLSQQLTAALAIVGNEVSREADNKFTSKLGKIVEHLMEKHGNSSHDASLEEGLVLLKAMMDGSNPAVQQAALRANINTGTLTLTAAAAA